jgi:uncharacterized protein (DUF736 family)
MTTKPNILLVHGAWGDGSHWRHVIPPLHAKGFRVRAVQNPLTSLADDECEILCGLPALREPPPGAAIIVPDQNGLLWLQPEQFRENFCQDLDETEALVMALSQKRLQPVLRGEVRTVRVESKIELVPAPGQREVRAQVLRSAHRWPLNHPSAWLRQSWSAEEPHTGIDALDGKLLVPLAEYAR